MDFCSGRFSAGPQATAPSVDSSRPSLAFLISVAAVFSYGVGQWPNAYLTSQDGFSFDWIPGGAVEINHGLQSGFALLNVEWSYQLDPLSAIFMLIVTGVLLGLALAACSSIGGGTTGTAGASSFSSIFGSSPAATVQTAAATDDDAYCPIVDVRQGASTITVHAPGDPVATNVRYQATIGQLAREAEQAGAGVSVDFLGKMGVGIAVVAQGPELPLAEEASATGDGEGNRAQLVIDAVGDHDHQLAGFCR